jgi:hypothetical protein
MRIFYFLLCFFCCFNPLNAQKAALQEALNDTTGFKWKEASVSWYFGGNQFIYRKRASGDPRSSKWKRYSLNISGDGSLSNTEKFFSLDEDSRRVYSLKLGVGFGRERRRLANPRFEKLFAVYGMDLIPIVSAYRSRTTSLVATGGGVQVLNLARSEYEAGIRAVPFVGLRYQLNQRFSVAFESGLFAYIGGNYQTVRDETSLPGATIKANNASLEFNVNTIPLRALWVTYAF